MYTKEQRCNDSKKVTRKRLRQQSIKIDLIYSFHLLPYKAPIDA